MSQSRIGVKPIDEESASIASFPTELRGAYIRKSQNSFQDNVKLIFTDEKGNMVLDKITGDIKTVTVDRTYFNSVLSICAEPPADTGANSTFALAGSLSNQLAANSAAASNLSRAISNANSGSNSNSTNKNNIDGENDENSKSRSIDASRSTELSRTATSDNSLSTSASNNLAVQANLNLSREVVELQGRTQLVLLAREFMYRNCEAAANGYISREDYLTLHKASINQVSEMLKASVSKAEAENTAAEAKKTAAEAKKAEADAKKIEAETERLKILTKTDGTIFQSQLKYCKSELLKCIKVASGNSEKETVCSTTYDKCIVKK
jgi:hypothetical protein